MWSDYLFTQRNKTTERAVGVGVEGEGERGGTWTKFEKGARQYRVGLGKIKGLGPLCQR